MREIAQFDGQATTRIGLQLLGMLTQRPGEIRNAKWTKFYFTDKIWSIPAEKMKMRRDHLVPLPDQAIALLDELRSRTATENTCSRLYAHENAPCRRTPLTPLCGGWAIVSRKSPHTASGQAFPP